MVSKSKMDVYIALIRGVNVGGKNKVPMAELRACLEKEGFSHVSTYLATGNVILASDKKATDIRALIETAVAGNFALDDGLVRVLVLTRDQFAAVVDNKPEGFGDEAKKYRYDALFLMDLEAGQAMSVVNPREGVDKAWPSEKVIYWQRLSSQLTKSRLSRIVGTPEYKYITVRSWNTAIRLLEKAERLAC